ncbi:MAG: type I glyceraldehyde-3-phosphate dehydrogenase [Bacteroidetes bacterium]|jgi:glyceraldehyde 3-phosphate dehydrogenase|nr:type I glyceraldehyde-3-phosphate dehydrogenase [Bacteroidota bacterium]
MKRIAINGFGRIGRTACKIIMDTDELEIVAVNDVMSLESAAYLLTYDSVYGSYEREVTIDENRLTIDQHSIHYSSIKDPARLPWKSLDVDVVIECTGRFTSWEDAEKHIAAGAEKVVISGPTKSKETPTVIHGVNTGDGTSAVYSCASCTTNNITPLVEIMGRHIGIKKAILNTTHAYTSTQSIVDAPSEKDQRRGRTAGVSLTPTTTGAAKATVNALPEFEGKFDGLAVRTPVPAGCISDITFVAERPTTAKEVNAIFKKESQSERYNNVIDTNEDRIVSSDIIKQPFAAIIDLTLTKVVDGDLVKLMAWYDNEWGFTSQIVRQIQS